MSDDEIVSADEARGYLVVLNDESRVPGLIALRLARTVIALHARAEEADAEYDRLAQLDEEMHNLRINALDLMTCEFKRMRARAEKAEAERDEARRERDRWHDLRCALWDALRAIKGHDFCARVEQAADAARKEAP